MSEDPSSTDLYHSRRRPTLVPVAAADPAYFSDQELGPRPLALDELPPEAWTGIAATFHRFADQQFFASDFPVQCPDGEGVSGTSMAGVRALLVAHVPRLGDWPREQNQPDTVTAMDVVVFGWRHVQQPTVVDNHSYFRHDHYTFDQAAGRSLWRDEVNLILERNGVGLRQEVDGRVVRTGLVASSVLTRSPLPSIGDVALDGKISTALRKYESPDVAVRREALESLWDAFERIKTVIDPSDKRRSAAALVDLIVPDGPSRVALTQEFETLTRLGNEFQIRHHEVARHAVAATMIDVLFARGLAVLEVSLQALVARETG